MAVKENIDDIELGKEAATNNDFAETQYDENMSAAISDEDPFGKTYEYSKGLSGNDVWIPFEKCVADFKSLDNPNFKFAHRFIRAEHLGV